MQTTQELISEIETKIQIHSIIKSELDHQVNDIYHYIEFSRFNAYQGYLLSKKLKDVLVKRREMKEIISHLTSYRDLIKSKSVEMEQRSKERIRKYKEEVELKDVLGGNYE